MARRTRTRTLTAAVALAASATLLTACGGDDDPSSDKIKGAGDTSSSPAPAEPEGVERPEIELPATFDVSFSSWTDSDPEKQAILDDGRERLRSAYAAIIDSEPDAEHIGFYNARGALSTGRDWVSGYVEDDLTLVGEVAVFDPEVRITPSGRGVLFYCVDEGKAFTEDRQTGEKEGTPPGDDPRVLYQTGLGKNQDGVWKTVSVQTKRGECG